MQRMKAGLLAMALLVIPNFLTMYGALSQDVQRGKYLVSFAGCLDCHTPGYFFGKPDMSRLLGGSEVGFEIPNLGVFHGPNLTPDKETGVGDGRNSRSSPHSRRASARMAASWHP